MSTFCPAGSSHTLVDIRSHSWDPLTSLFCFSKHGFLGCRFFASRFQRWARAGILLELCVDRREHERIKGSGENIVQRVTQTDPNHEEKMEEWGDRVGTREGRLKDQEVVGQMAGMMEKGSSGWGDTADSGCGWWWVNQKEMEEEEAGNITGKMYVLSWFLGAEAVAHTLKRARRSVVSR